MSLDNISQFLSAIDRAGEMTRIREPVKARLELCEIADRVMKQPRGGSALYQTYFHHVLPLIGRLVSGHRTAYHYLPRSVANFPVEEELAKKLENAGFNKVRWTSLSFGVAAIHVGERPISSIGAK